MSYGYGIAILVLLVILGVFTYDHIKQKRNKTKITPRREVDE